MATSVHIPVEEYLRCSYEPDCDFIEGEVRSRGIGTQSHGILQFLLVKWFDDRFDSYGCVAVPEQRLRVGPERYRVPDVCVLMGSGAGEEVVVSTPLACIEVLSPDDTLPGLEERVKDSLGMGVRNVWIFDPVGCSVWVATDGGAMMPFPGDRLPVKGTDLSMVLPELFAELKRRLKRTPKA